jgi:hypothetical protein
MVSMLVSIAVYRVFEPRLDQTNDYNIDVCCFSTKHSAWVLPMIMNYYNDQTYNGCAANVNPRM